MAVEWYYQQMGEAIGPISPDELVERTQSGDVQADTPVRKGVDGDWVSAWHVRGLFDRPAPAAASGRETPVETVPAEQFVEVAMPRAENFFVWRVTISGNGDRQRSAILSTHDKSFQALSQLAGGIRLHAGEMITQVEYLGPTIVFERT